MVPARSGVPTCSSGHVAGCLTSRQSLCEYWPRGVLGSQHNPNKAPRMLPGPAWGSVRVGTTGSLVPPTLERRRHCLEVATLQVTGQVTQLSPASPVSPARPGPRGSTGASSVGEQTLRGSGPQGPLGGAPQGAVWGHRPCQLPVPSPSGQTWAIQLDMLPSAFRQPAPQEGARGAPSSAPKPPRPCRLPARPPCTSCFACEPGTLMPAPRASLGRREN